MICTLVTVLPRKNTLHVKYARKLKSVSFQLGHAVIPNTTNSLLTGFHGTTEVDTKSCCTIQTKQIQLVVMAPFI